MTFIIRSVWWRPAITIFKSYDFLKGFISGLYAGNYDITHVFIDSLTKIVASEATDHAVEEFLDWLNSFSEKNNIKFTVTISADASLPPTASRNTSDTCPFSGPCRRQGRCLVPPSFRRQIACTSGIPPQNFG